MQVTPKNLFIGMIDLFSVVLPGALVTYFLIDQGQSELIGVGNVFTAPKTTTQQWLVFLLASYIVGNVVFVTASFLLGQFVYEKFLRNVFFKKNFDLCLHTATEIRNQYLRTDPWIDRHIQSEKLTPDERQELLSRKRREIISTFDWAENFLTIKYPELLTDIRKVAADSKFFRSFALAFIISASLLFAQPDKILAGGFFMILSGLCLLRYGDLRYKTSENICELIVVIHHLEMHPMSSYRIAETGAAPPQNRMEHFISSVDANAWDQRVSHLTKGLDVDSSVLSIPMGESWKETNLQLERTVLCLSGQCMAKVGAGQDETIDVILSPNATATLAPHTPFEISNTRQEPLLLLALQPEK